MNAEWQLSETLKNKLIGSPESGMGYQVVRVSVKNGATYDNVIVTGGNKITGIYGHDAMPFTAADVEDVELTHMIKPQDFNPSRWLYLDR